MMVKIIMIMFAIVFGMIVILTILTDPDPSVASDIQPVEVRNEYDAIWQSSIIPIDDNRPSDSKTPK
jgi:hypothetical protein